MTKKELIKSAKEKIIECKYTGMHSTASLIEQLCDMLEQQEDVVRCKDCKFCSIGKDYFLYCCVNTDCHSPDYYCADGKRK